jgi:hypothetical protein
MKRAEMMKPMHDVAASLIRQRLAKFLPEGQRPPDAEEPQAEAPLADDDVALLEQSLGSQG